MALRIIGAGLGRTATLSMKLALEHLGYGPCYHMLEIMAAPETRLPQWIEVVRGNPDWHAIFAGFSSTVDYPACYFWRELADHYPDAKVILTTRDAEGWFASVNRTIMAPDAVASMRGGPFAEFMEGSVIKDFGDRIDDADFMADYFRRWEQSVIDALPSERLLVHRPGDGWEPLCAFLDVAVPEQPYPRVNTTQDMNSREEMVQKLTDEGNGASSHARGYMDAMRNKAFGG